ncbi:Toll/interleukin-1 receptor domain-containing protein, partial [Tanacetum coccineum]
MFLIYGGDIKRELMVSSYTDAGYLTDADDLKSQTGYMFVLNGEAEYIAAFDSSKEAVWVKKFISGLGVVPTIEKPINMYCDNTGAIAIANESRITTFAKVSVIDFQWVLDTIVVLDIREVWTTSGRACLRVCVSICRGGNLVTSFSFLVSLFSGVYEVLEQKSLITVDECGFLRMHDHIEEMGKNIVRRSHPDEPYQHSRLWIDDEIEDILANDMVKISLLVRRFENSYERSWKMINLRYLEVEFKFRFSDSSQLDESTKYFPNSLKYLRFKNYPFLYLPKTFQANNLVGLDMKYSRMVQLWEEGDQKVLQKLKFLSLSESKLRTFDLGLTPNLETLSLDNCANFEELHVHVACPNLKFLNLRRSRYNISDLPQSIFGLKGLVITASSKLLQLYDFPLKTTTRNETDARISSIYAAPDTSVARIQSSCHLIFDIGSVVVAAAASKSGGGFINPLQVFVKIWGALCQKDGGITWKQQIPEMEEKGMLMVNVEKALDWFLKGVARGSTLAMVDAGLVYWEIGKKDEGVRMYKRAAELGNPAGQCNLGISYLQ